MSVLIIAELGATHEGRFGTMISLIDAASQSGSDAVKFQWTSDAAKMCERRHAPEYLADYLKLQFPIAWHLDLRARAASLGLQYGCSFYAPDDAASLAPFVDFLKVSSFESDDQAMFDAARRSDVARIYSSDGATDGHGRFWGASWLHCVSCYPAPLSALNLRVCSDTDFYVGFSDHSHDVRVGAWAVAAGAELIETHMRLDDCDPANKDYAVSFTPAELAEYVRGIRDCETAMGDGVKRVQECERAMEKFKVKS